MTKPQLVIRALVLDWSLGLGHWSLPLIGQRGLVIGHFIPLA
jgi:hypothetical protein